MRRRHYLAGVGALLASSAGCISPGSSQGSSVIERTVSLVRVNDEPQEYDIDLSVEVTEPAITAEHTATVEVAFSNTGSSESPQLGFGHLYELSPVTCDYDLSAPDEILLYGTDIPWRQPSRSDSCWETDEAGGPGDGGAGGQNKTLESGATLTRAYRVWDSLPETECMPPGEYRFGFRDDSESPPFAWMFTLGIESRD